MLFFIDLIFVMVFALILSSILGWGFGWRHPAHGDAIGASFLFLFLVLFFAMWAIGGWLPPWGPVVYETPWLGLLLVGIFVSLILLAAVTPARRRPSPAEAVEEAREEVVAATAFGIFFWILMIGLLIAVAARYLM